MGLLKEAVNSSAFLKCGILGFQGSGKTYTSTEIAIGLTKMIGGKKVAMMDTEAGSDYLIPKFKKQGISLFIHKGRAFKDACDIIAESEQAGYSVLIFDSVSHIWQELKDSYIKKLNRKNGLYFQDWGPIKLEWQRFTDLFLNSKLHIILCGRASWEYDNEKNEDTGRNELIKTGTKMRAESEFGYEPSLLLEMERFAIKNQAGFVHRCFVLKDRTGTINGKEFDNPTFENFTPFIKFLNIGGTHLGVDTTRNSQDMFDSPDKSYANMQRQREIQLEELQAVLIKVGCEGSSQDAKKKRVEVLEKTFGTSSKTKLELLSPDELKAGINSLKLEHGLVAAESQPPLFDSSEPLPDMGG